MKEVTVMLELDKWQLKKLDEFAALRRKTEIVPRPDNCYTHEATLRYILRVVSFDAIMDEATAWEEKLLKNRKEAVSEFWEVEPLEDGEAEPDEPETFSDPEELPHVETLVPFGEPEEPETLIPIRDADGVRRMATLDEVEAMREAAQGIYEGRTPEPTEETETLVPVIDALGARRMATLDEVEAMREAAQGIYEGRTPEPEEELEMVDVYHIVHGDGVILETVETNLYTTALEWRDITAERLGVDSDMLDVMTAEEYESEWGDGEEEEPETDSNAEELPAVRRGPLMDDKSDLYFYLLEGRNVG